MLNFNIDQGVRSMKDSVSAVFVSKTRVYFIKRQNYLPAFPGYHATPGGKIDPSDGHSNLDPKIWPTTIAPNILQALIREVQEELDYDLLEGIRKGEVSSIDYIGVAITPEFNPYRFNNYYLKITLAEEINFNVDANEALFGEWKTPLEFLEDYSSGKMLAVPPTIRMLEVFAKNLLHEKPIDFMPPFDNETDVPMFESIAGVRQIMPLSNTFPPANRTNAFIIGDDGRKKILVDPSPKNENELGKFLNTIDKVGFDSIFLTHHHPDHYQYSREIALKYGVAIELSEYTLKNIGTEYFKDIVVVIRKEGDIVTTSLGQDIYVYEIPGHDEGQLGLAPKNLAWFLVGDLIQTIGTVVIGAPEGDMKKYFSSLERVISLKPANIIPSHGIILGGTHKLSETLKHRKIREEQIIDLVKHNKTEEEILHIIYQNINIKLLPYAKKTLDAHLLKLKDEQRI